MCIGFLSKSGKNLYQITSNGLVDLTGNCSTYHVSKAVTVGRNGDSACHFMFTGSFLSRLQLGWVLHTSRIVKFVNPNPLLEGNRVKFERPPSSIVPQSTVLSYGAEIKSELVLGDSLGSGRPGIEPSTKNGMPLHPNHTPRWGWKSGQLHKLHLKACNSRISQNAVGSTLDPPPARCHVKHRVRDHFFGGAVGPNFLMSRIPCLGGNSNFRYNISSI